MVEAVDVDGPISFIDPVDDSVLSEAGIVPTSQLAIERAAHPVRVGDQTTEAELDDGADDARRSRCQAVELSGRGDDQRSS